MKLLCLGWILLSTQWSFALENHIPHFRKTAEINFAAVGDFGTPGPDADRVANQIKSWKPDFIITMGDNNYPEGEPETADENIGKRFAPYIRGYSGAYGAGSPYTRFFPSLGNHDWECAKCKRTPKPYLHYFSLGKSERYYDFEEGPVHFFALDSDSREPDGVDKTSVQANWLRTQLAKSTSAFNVVYFHHAPYSSGPHGDDTGMQWPFREWGADAVLTGHDHIYERYDVGGIPYFVNGLGGRSKTPVGPRRSNCKAQYAVTYGAMKITANPQRMIFRFISDSGSEVDQVLIQKRVRK